MTVGILALQGCIDPHLRMFDSIKVDCLRVRSAEELSKVNRLIIPGGESTTMLRLIDAQKLWEPLLLFGKRNPVWGICAGAILIAKEVHSPKQKSLGLIEISAHRNFYGSQRESFSARVNIPSELEVDFIRAPLLKPLNSAVETLGSYRSESIFLKQGRVIATSFHTELRTNPLLHQYFLAL